jgi:hypothetical protein
MKKIHQALITVLSLVIILILKGSAFSEDLCFIKWQGDIGGSCAITSETSRTQQAAYEVHVYLVGQDAQLSWGGSCYSGLRNIVSEGVSEMSLSSTACIDGTWDKQYYVCSDCIQDATGCFFGCYEGVNSGTWGVICGPDSDFDCDSDGIPDEEDECPFENHYGSDANDDGCIDRLEDLPAVIQDLNLKLGIEKKLISLAIDSLPYIDDDGIWHTNTEEIMDLKALVGKKAGKAIPQEDADMLIDYIKHMLFSLEL